VSQSELKIPPNVEVFVVDFYWDGGIRITPLGAETTKWSPSSVRECRVLRLVDREACVSFVSMGSDQFSAFNISTSRIFGDILSSGSYLKDGILNGDCVGEERNE
jgi:hypothetical protein